MFKQILFITPIIIFSWFIIKKGEAVAPPVSVNKGNIIKKNNKNHVHNDTKLYYCQDEICEDVIDVAISKIPKLKPLLKRQSYKQKYCLAQNIYHEASIEPFEGKILVGKATISRVLSKEFPNTICGVVRQKNAMSWTKDAHKRKKKIPIEFITLAENIINGKHGIIKYHYTNWYNVALDSIYTDNAKILTGRKKGFKLVSSFSIPDSNHIFISYKRVS